MGGFTTRRRRAIWLSVASALSILCATPALAQDQDLAEELRALREEVNSQRALITNQQQQIEQQQRQIEQLRAVVDPDASLAAIRGAGLPSAPSPLTQTRFAQTDPVPGSSPQVPTTPVGEAPPERQIQPARVLAVPEELGVLTPTGRLVFDPQFEYVLSTTNRLVFRGIELIPGIQIGAIEASDVDRDTLIGTAAARYGITSRLEAEIRVPYLYRRDRIEVVQQRDEGIVRTIELEERDLGDIEFALRYQLNRPRPLRPIWIAQLRAKSDTGRSPFEIPFDEFGVATGLATGSGFWGLQPGLSFLLPSDPVVLYGGLSYLWNIPGNIDEVIGDVLVGRVDPGDAISGNVGFGFAVNPRFSFSLGYRHTYIFPTTTELGGTLQRSNRSQVGALSFGMSYLLTEEQAINLGFNLGVTADSPDLSISIRMPFQTVLFR